MQAVVDRMFAGAAPEDFGENLVVACTGGSRPPRGFEGRWEILPTDDHFEIPSWVNETSLTNTTCILAVSNVRSPSQFEALATLGGYLHQHALVAPPMVLISVDDGDSDENSRELPLINHLLGRAVVDDLVWGMPCGFSLVFAVKAKLCSISAMLSKVQHQLCQRASQAQLKENMQSSIDFVQWQYLGARLLHNIPPVRNDINDMNGQGIAGIRLAGKLCRGIFGVTYKTAVPQTPVTVGHHYSMMVVEKREKHRCLQELKMINRFFYVMSTLNRVLHPNVSELVSVFHMPQRVYVCMEIAGRRSLYSRLKARDTPKDGERRGISTQALVRIITQASAAVSHIHQVHDVCHRDLKPENFTISEGDETDINVKLGGFDLALVQAGGVRSRSPCGTLPFAAPELFLSGDRGYDGKASDMWSLGILAMEVCCGIRVVETVITKMTGVERFHDEFVWQMRSSGTMPFGPQIACMIRDLFSQAAVFDQILECITPEAIGLLIWFRPFVEGLARTEPETRLDAAKLQAALPMDV